MLPFDKINNKIQLQHEKHLDRITQYFNKSPFAFLFNYQFEMLKVAGRERDRARGRGGKSEREEGVMSQQSISEAFIG